jgi:hypothetical protein
MLGFRMRSYLHWRGGRVRREIPNSKASRARHEPRRVCQQTLGAPDQEHILGEGRNFLSGEGLGNHGPSPVGQLLVRFSKRQMGVGHLAGLPLDLQSQGADDCREPGLAAGHNGEDDFADPRGVVQCLRLRPATVVRIDPNLIHIFQLNYLGRVQKQRAAAGPPGLFLKEALAIDREATASEFVIALGRCAAATRDIAAVVDRKGPEEGMVAPSLDPRLQMARTVPVFVMWKIPAAWWSESMVARQEILRMSMKG